MVSKYSKVIQCILATGFIRIEEDNLQIPKKIYHQYNVNCVNHITMKKSIDKSKYFFLKNSRIQI